MGPPHPCTCPVDRNKTRDAPSDGCAILAPARLSDGFLASARRRSIREFLKTSDHPPRSCLEGLRADAALSDVVAALAPSSATEGETWLIAQLTTHRAEDRHSLLLASSLQFLVSRECHIMAPQKNEIYQTNPLSAAASKSTPRLHKNRVHGVENALCNCKKMSQARLSRGGPTARIPRTCWRRVPTRRLEHSPPAVTRRTHPAFDRRQSI